MPAMLYEASWPELSSSAVILQLAINSYVKHICIVSCLGDHGNNWFEAMLTIWTLPWKSFIFGFEAIRGSDYMSDIAVDDVNLMQGPCNSTG